MLIMGACPPWHSNVLISESPSKRVVNLGYGFIGNPPYFAYNEASPRFGGEISFSILILQWFLVSALAGGLVYLKKDA